jgi:hypothetical protein
MPGDNPGARRIHGPNGPAFAIGHGITRNRAIGGIPQQGPLEAPSMGSPNPFAGAGHHSQRPASMPFQFSGQPIGGPGPFAGPGPVSHHSERPASMPFQWNQGGGCQGGGVGGGSVRADEEIEARRSRRQ